VGRPELPNPTGVAFLLEPIQVSFPRNEVVDLLELHASSEELKLSVELGAALVDGRRPDLRGHKGLFAALGERTPERPLCAPVHRRGIDEADTFVESRTDDRVDQLLAFFPDIEREP